MMIAAIAVGVYAVTTIASAYAILAREIARNYIATNPASALIDLDAVEPALVDAMRRRSDVSAAEATSIVTARIERRPDEWTRLLLFVIPDFDVLDVNKIFPQAGAYPPPEGTILLEREALAYLGARVGGTVRLQTPTGPKTAATVSGTVHDPSLAPAWQEQTAYGYVTPATLVRLGGTPTLDTLKIVVRDALHDQPRVDAVAADIALALRAQGLQVHQVQVPPTGRHPHQTQMTAVLTMFIIFAFLALVLSAILTASMIDGLLAQQVRQIAVMKAIGARSGQIAGLYITGISVIAGTSALAGTSLGILSGRRFADVIAQLLNFDIASHGLPWWLIAAFIAGGLAIPVAFALVPIRSAMQKTVRETISDYGVSRKAFGSSWFDGALAKLSGIDRTLILAIRNAFRRRGRLVLTLALLGAAGAMFLASLNVQKAWNHFIAASARDRNYDLELRLERPVPTGALLATVAGERGVKSVEPWSVTSAAAGRPDGLAVVRTYPDRGHANLEFRSMPDANSLSHLVLLEGRPPRSGETDAVLLNQGAQYLLGRPHADDRIRLTVDGHTASYRVAGIVRQIVTLPAVFIQATGYQSVTGTKGKANAIRVVTSDHRATAIARLARAIEARLQREGIRVVLSMSETQVDAAVGGHVKILVVSLIMMSVLMASVGLLGLASAQGTNVAERTREFGIMRTIGGTNAVIIRNVVAEGVLVGLLSVALAVVLALPLTAVIGNLVGRLSFGLPLPLMPSVPALAAWIAITALGAIAASLPPALSAARLTVRETLAHA